MKILKKELHNYVWNQISNQIRYLVFDQVWNQAFDRLRALHWTRNRSQIRNTIKDKLNENN